MGERATLVERLSAGLANRIGRRSFLARTAVVGSALTVAPADLLLRPTTAYAAVCSCVGESCACGALCCDGYTEFCCSIYGPNACPAGTAVAGWWKADGSGFCGGPRYYMDCNAQCGGCGCDGTGLCSGACSGTGCGCANGNCNERRAGCNEFRYGQCNQAVPCLGPIVCRLVTCIPPWEIEATCTTAPATDDSTGPHDAPCLHVAQGGLGGASVNGGVLTLTGWALDPDLNGPIAVDVYIDGVLTDSVLANQPWSDGVLEHQGHGFVAQMTPITPFTHEVCAYAHNAGPGPADPLVGCVAVPASLAQGALSSVTATDGVLTVTGWALNPAISGPITVDVQVDGVVSATVVANQPSSDGVASHQGHGFTATVAGISPAGHEVCGFGRNDEIGAARSLLGCLPVAPSLVWNYRYSLGAGPPDLTQVAGDPGSIPVAGHWHAGAADSPGAFRAGVWHLRDALVNSVPDTQFEFGNPGDLPVAGDWNGDGTDTIGIYRDTTFYLRNSNTAGPSDVIIAYGNPGDLPVVGDWNGDGTDTIGVYRAGTFYLRNSNTPGPADIVFAFGDPAGYPLMGNWLVAPAGWSSTSSLGPRRAGDTPAVAR